MKRILVIRGGAIGDFILTLPVLEALRDAYPTAEIEVLGYKHIAELVNHRFYANRVRSIEYAPLAGFFSANAQLDPELMDYFATFDLILTYLYDPDLIFEGNLRRCGVEEILRGPARIQEHSHATAQLAAPLSELALSIADSGTRLHLSEQDRQRAAEFLNNLPLPIVAVHPGSGSEKKNWPLENWTELGNALSAAWSMVVVSGEADQKQLHQLRSAWRNPNIRFATDLPLPDLAAVLAGNVFVGHDSGISHLAAATGARCILLFGPTAPEVWAPRGDNVTVIRAPDADLRRLRVDTVLQHVLAISRDSSKEPME